MENSLALATLFEKQSFRCRKDALTDEFINSLQPNDIFSFHCRDFVKYLGFKRCDKKFRERFTQWLAENSIGYVITNQHLTPDMVNNFFNAKKIVREGLDKPYYPWADNLGQKGGRTPRELYNWMIETKQTDKTFEELVEHGIDLHKRIYSIEIKEDKQKLSGSFNSGCWLVLWKNL